MSKVSSECFIYVEVTLHPLSRGLFCFTFLWLFLNQINNFCVRLDDCHDSNISEALTNHLMLDNTANDTHLYIVGNIYYVQ